MIMDQTTFDVKFVPIYSGTAFIKNSSIGKFTSWTLDSRWYPLKLTWKGSAQFLKYAPCMQTIEKENEVCFNQYNRKMNEIQAKTPMDDITQEDILISQEAFSKTMKRKRDAADEGIKNVCW
ncbi:hypothetical protein D910_01868 [Dendroctonus ponderosae]|uniref:Uncharacterized protein n=1 Tax=Dendroctonus ponderosae TaxID=77166 RepID=U4U1G4_DENPD|nr:hypothetical protein D910_01868 [Dendroctonus ponderosae]